MKTGFRGTFVISWSQTETDGQTAAPRDALRVGAVWSWSGEAVRVDGPPEVLPLGDAVGASEIRRRAAHAVRRLLRAVEADTAEIDRVAVDVPLFETGFQVTDGRDLWMVTLIDVGPGRHPLCLFAGEIPPRTRELWIVSETLLPTRPRGPGAETAEVPGVVCFADGTLIATERGEIPVEDLTPGTRVQTRDDGLQDVVWTGASRVTGARLQAMPDLAPIRIATGDRPLLVSPDHRVLIAGRAARTLFNTPEVLVAARDLLDLPGIAVDRTRREVTYHHLLLPSHQIVLANGVETESFHPGDGALDRLSPADRIRLAGAMPETAADPSAYGGHARRLLRPSEAALLRHEAA